MFLFIYSALFLIYVIQLKVCLFTIFKFSFINKKKNLGNFGLANSAFIYSLIDCVPREIQRVVHQHQRTPIVSGKICKRHLIASHPVVNAISVHVHAANPIIAYWQISQMFLNEIVLFLSQNVG